MEDATKALQLLQQYVGEGKSYTEDADHIIFGDVKFPKTLETGLKTATKTYQLHSLAFFYKDHVANQKLPEEPENASSDKEDKEEKKGPFRLPKNKFMSEYFKHCAAQSVSAVQYMDYDFVLNFLARKDAGAGAAGEYLYLLAGYGKSKKQKAKSKTRD